MVQPTEAWSESQDIVNILMENVVNEVMRRIGVRASVHASLEPCYESFEGLKLQTYGAEDLLESMISKTGSIEKVRETEYTESFNINAHLSDVIFPSLPDLCCSLSTTSNQGEGDYQHNAIREAVAFYHRQASNSSMITETSNSDIAEILKDKINSLSFDAIQLNDDGVDDPALKPKQQVDNSNRFSVIPGQICSEVDVTERGKDELLQNSQRFCHFNNKQYLPFESNCCPLINEDCVVQDLEEERELLSESSNELVNIVGDSEENWIPVKRFLETNPLICSATHSSLHLSSPCFSDMLSLDSANDMSTITVVADVEPIKELSNWEEAVEVQINVTEPEKTEPDVSEPSDVIKAKTYLSSVGLMRDLQVDPSYLGPVDLPGLESVPNVRRVEVKYPMKEPEDEIWMLEHGTDEDEDRTLSDKELSTNNHINYLSIADKAEKEKKKRNFVSRLGNSILNLVRSKKRNRNKP